MADKLNHRDVSSTKIFFAGVALSSFRCVKTAAPIDAAVVSGARRGARFRELHITRNIVTKIEFGYGILEYI